MTNQVPPAKSAGVRPGLWWFSIIVISVCALVGTYMLFVEPPPPRRIVIATGGEKGAYYKFAQKYAELLKKEGLELEVRKTAGTVENLKLLQDDNSGVAVALVQSGVADETARENLQALGSLYREPLWIFYRGAEKLDTLAQLRGKRIAVGPEGSGTRAIALFLLAANDIPDAEFEKKYPNIKTELRDDSADKAVALLKNGEIDVAFFVASIEASYIQELLKEPSVQLVPLGQQAAYLRRYRFLSGVTIPAGLIDLKKNLPAADVALVAPTATLVARNDLHPALITLLLTTATKVHAAGDLLSNPDEFPTPNYTDLPLSDEAKRFYKSGPPVLQRILPFWLASMVDRLKVMLIPLLMLLMPLFRAAPPLVRWRTRRKIYRWYESLREIDQKLMAGLGTGEAQMELAKLQAIEGQINHVEVPLSYMEELYNLRLHVTMIHEKLEKRLAQK